MNRTAFVLAFALIWQGHYGTGTAEQFAAAPSPPPLKPSKPPAIKRPERQASLF